MGIYFFNSCLIGQLIRYPKLVQNLLNKNTTRGIVDESEDELLYNDNLLRGKDRFK